MGAILTTPCSHVLFDRAVLVPDDRDIADHWAKSVINDNPAYRWVIGKYVEADNPNQNNQMWTFDGLNDKAETVLHAPMNMLHRSNHIVGAFVGVDMMYPTTETAEDGLRPFIEAAGAFWQYYFPNELAVITQAHNEGSLFFSMECVSETLTIIRPDGASQEFPYMGPAAEPYGEWGAKENVRRFNNPHFLGGALVVPPAKPGWKGAEVKELANMISQNQEEAGAVYEAAKAGAPQLDESVWEELMLTVMARAHKNI